MIPKTYTFVNSKQQLLKIKVTDKDVMIQTIKGWLSTKYMYLYDRAQTKESSEQTHNIMLNLLKNMTIEEQDQYITDEARHLGFVQWEKA